MGPGSGKQCIKSTSSALAQSLHVQLHVIGERNQCRSSSTGSTNSWNVSPACVRTLGVGDGVRGIGHPGALAGGEDGRSNTPVEVAPSNRNRVYSGQRLIVARRN
jgi:hypothetical protein